LKAPHSRRWSIETWVRRVITDTQTDSGPVDLFAVARLRSVRKIGLRFIIPGGVLLPVSDGFEIYLQHSERAELDVSSQEPLGLLSSRQRFALAHEIAHTYFYDLSQAVPFPMVSSPAGPELERLCNRVAGHLLLPTDYLKRAVGSHEDLDATMIRQIARRLRASLHVTIERLASLEAPTPVERCVVMAKRENGDAVIQALYFGVGLLSTIRRPTKYSRLSEWLPNLPLLIITERTDEEWESTLPGRTVSFKKTELGRGQTFLLEAQSKTSAARSPALSGC